MTMRSIVNEGKKAKSNFLLDGRSQCWRNPAGLRWMMSQERIKGLPTRKVRGPAKVGQVRGKPPIK